MTKEEAKNWLNKLYTRADITDEYGDMEDMQPYKEAVNMAIEALSAEPCEDAISRQAVLEAIEDDIKGRYSCFASNNDAQCFKDDIRSLPSITPKQKMGHWIEGFGGCGCSECGCLEAGYSNYCPTCGAKMEESEGEK